MKNITIKLFLISLVFNYAFAEEATKSADVENELEETNEVFLE